MKKRILSMLLAVITVVAMIPAALVTAIAEETTPTPGYADGYDVFVSAVEPVINGEKDDIYDLSETIIQTHYADTNQSEVTFKAYALITEKGLNIFVDVIDTTVSVAKEKEYLNTSGKTDPGLGDKITVFLQIANTVNGSTKWAWGYFDMDYALDSITKHGNFNHSNCKPQKVSTIKTSNEGYTMEFLMPWANCSSTLNNGPITPETVDVYFGVQVNNYGSASGAGSYKNTSYDNPKCQQYYYSTSTGDAAYEPEPNKAPKNLMIHANETKEMTETFKGYYNGYDVYVSETELTLDGQMDSAYLNSEKLVSHNHYNSLPATVKFEAYYIATEEGIYSFAIVTDSTVDMENEAKDDYNYGDYNQIYYQIINTSNGATEYFSQFYYVDYAHSTNGNLQIRSAKTTNGYMIETFMPWNNWSEKITIETLQLYVGYQVNDATVNTQTQISIAYDNPLSQGYYGGDYSAGTSAPTKKMIPVNFSRVDGRAGYHNGYDTIVAVPEQLKTDNDSTPHVDGLRDDIYLSSEKIVPGYYYVHNGKASRDVYFEIYTATTEEGLYVWAEITDSTVDAEKEASYENSDRGDKLQICLEVENKTKSLSKWGCFDIDYSGKDIYYGTRGKYNSVNCTPEYITKIVDGGWVAEFFISWSDAIGDCDFSEISAYVGFQVNNYGGDDSLPYGQAYDNPEAANYYQKEATNVSIEHFIPLNFQYSGNQPLDNKGANIPAFKVYSFEEGADNPTDTITVDGFRDETYFKSQRISEKKVVGSGTGFDAYIVATEKGLYLYADIEDTTLDSSTDYIKFYLTDPVKPDKNTAANSVNYVQLNFDNTTVTGEGVIVADVTCKTTAIKDAYRNSYGWTAELFVPWTAISNFANEVEADRDTDKLDDPKTDTVQRAPYECAVGISVNNGSNVSYCSSSRTNWENTTFFDYGIVSANNYTVEKDQSKSYYVPLTYTTRCPEVNTVFVTNREIVLDGKPDEIYKQSSKITQRAGYSDSISKELKFTAYYVATLEGLYVWVETNDSTMNNVFDTDANTGDMVQIYLDWTLNYRSHEITGATANDYRFNDKYFFGGWISVDYEGGISATNDMSTVKPFVKTAVEKYKNEDWNGTDPETQYKGYAIETFIPWTDEIKDQLGVHANDIHMGIGIQFSDDTTYDYDKSKIVEPYYKDVNGNICAKDDPNVQTDDNGDPKDQRSAEEWYGNEYRQYIVYDTSDGGAYYGSYERVPDVNFVYDDDLAEYSRFIADKVDSVVVDGHNTNGEYDHASVIHANLAGSGVADDGDVLRVVTTEDAIYILMEVIDNTPSTAQKQEGNYLDYIDLGVNFGGRFTTMYSFNRSESAPQWYTPDKDLSTARWWNYEYAPSFGTGYIACTNTADKWTYEIKFDLTEADKAKIEAGTFYFGLGAQFLDSYDTDGDHSDGERNYKYTVNNSGIYLGDFIIGSYKSSATVDYATQNHKNFPSELYKFNYFLFKSNDSRITGANVALGESISIKYYAYVDNSLLDEYHDNVYMKFTMNDRVTMVKGTPISGNSTNVNGNYEFIYEGVAPQCLIDNIEAELCIACIKDTSYKAEKLEYSVLQNLNNVKTDANKALIEALLHYGAAAQKYMNYKTGKLANKVLTSVSGYVAPDYDKTYGAAVQANNQKTIGAATIDGAQFTALGVHHSNVNKIYAKITVKNTVDVSKLEVTINGKSAIMELYSEGENENVYIVYTDPINVKGFDDLYTIVLSNGTSSQTITYSINAYAKTKWGNNASVTVVNNLARALYAYGVAAEAYAG